MHIILNIKNSEIILPTNNIAIWSTPENNENNENNEESSSSSWDNDEEETPTSSLPKIKYYISHSSRIPLEIPQKEYERIKSILKILNKETIKEIEESVAQENVKQELKKHLNGLLRMELGEP